MFWINYMLLCGQENKTPSGLAKELGISSGTVTGWKNGKIPSESSLNKIADHFGISKWDLLGEKNNPASSKDGGSEVASILNEDELTEKQRELIRLIPRLTDQEISVLLPQIRGLIFDR